MDNNYMQYKVHIVSQATMHTNWVGGIIFVFDRFGHVEFNMSNYQKIFCGDSDANYQLCERFFKEWRYYTHC